MEHELILRAIESIKDYEQLQAEYNLIKQELNQAKEYIKSLEERLGKPQIPRHILEKLKLQEQTIQELLEKKEALEMKNDEITDLMLNTQYSVQHARSAAPSKDKKPSILDLLKSEEVSRSITSCLDTKSLVNLISTSKSLQSAVCSKGYTWRHILRSITIPELPPQPLQVPAVSAEDSEEIGMLIDKYIANPSDPGETLEESLVKTTKVLLGLRKNAEIGTSTPQQAEKFDSITDLIVRQFGIERTTNLLHKSAAMFVANPTRMGEWINFLQNTFANLLFESASLLQKMKDVLKLTFFFVDKIRKLKKKVLEIDGELENTHAKLDAELKIKDHLVTRLHELDAKYAEILSELYDCKHSAQQLEMYSLELEQKSMKAQGEQEEKRALLAGEVFSLRKKVETATAQKKELVEAFKDFHRMFLSLN